MDQDEFVLGLRPVYSGGQSGMVRPRLVIILVSTCPFHCVATSLVQQVCVQLPTYADNVALPVFARLTPPL